MKIMEQDIEDISHCLNHIRFDIEAQKLDSALYTLNYCEGILRRIVKDNELYLKGEL